MITRPSIPHEQRSPAPSSRRADQRLIPILRALLDFFAVLLAFWTSILVRAWVSTLDWLAPINIEPAPYINMGILYGVLVVLVFWRLGLYKERASILNLQEMADALKGITLASALFLVVMFLGQITPFSRFVAFAGFGFSMLFIVLQRRLFSAFARGLGLSGRVGRRTVLIYGSGETGRLLMKKLVQAPHKACSVIGFLDDFAPRGTPVYCRIDQTTMEVYEARVLGRLQDLREIAREKGVNELLVTVSLTNAERHHELLKLAREAGVNVGVVPRFGEVRADQLEVEDLSAITLLRPRSTRSGRLYPAAKRGVDLLVASALMLVFLPAWALAAIGIRLESGSPVLFRQMRIGEGGRPFQMFKFRTMRKDTNPYETSPIGDNSDPRITRVGRLLRMVGMDELPQLVNVLKGEMSIVGPRPEMPFIVEKYTALERQRLEAKPGITGIWQLSSDRHAEIHENLEYDLYYIHHRSLLLDLLIMLETVFFTIGLASKFGHRDSDGHVTDSGVVIRPWRPTDARPRRDGYVLVALDQRWTGLPPESWVTCATLVETLVGHGQVKFLVAPDNVAAFDSLLTRPLSGESNGGGVAAEYVPYTGRSELRALTIGARMVVTDLEHVKRWALERNVELVQVDGAELRWSGRSGTRDAIVADLAERLTIEPAATGTAGAGAT
ncbi:MAG TPA: sugar transferase [Gemmatimonadota bacterium]|nr:sugar transferase [Gemmatimonadota bacterium]